MPSTTPRLTWRRQPHPTGMAGVIAAGEFHSLELWCDGQRLAVVDYARDRGAYYWYSIPAPWRYNSLWDGATFPTADEAKAAAKASIVAKLREEPTDV